MPKQKANLFSGVSPLLEKITTAPTFHEKENPATLGGASSDS
jgi:hypothetical protein